MRNRLILLPGWGLGSAPLEPLAAALQGLDERLRVQIEPLPAPGSADLGRGCVKTRSSIGGCGTMYSHRRSYEISFCSGPLPTKFQGNCSPQILKI